VHRLVIPLLLVVALVCVAAGFFVEINNPTTRNLGYAGALISAGPMLILIALAMANGPERGRAGGGSDH
jgi:hypothetical protein